AQPVRGQSSIMASAAARLIAPSRWRMVAGSAMALLLVGWIGFYQMDGSVWAPWAPKTAAEAQAYRKRMEAERQRLAARRAEERRQARYSSRVSQGNTDFNNNDYDRAIAAFDEAVLLDPKNPIAIVYRGTAYAGKGDYDRAIADYNEAIQFDPNYAVAFY